MPYTPAKFYASNPTVANATLYTVPAATTVLVKEIHLTNTTAVAAVGTVTLATKDYLRNVSVPANTTVIYRLSYPLTAGQVIEGLQTTASALIVHITGVTY